MDRISAPLAAGGHHGGLAHGGCRLRDLLALWPAVGLSNRRCCRTGGGTLHSQWRHDWRGSHPHDPPQPPPLSTLPPWMHGYRRPAAGGAATGGDAARRAAWPCGCGCTPGGTRTRCDGAPPQWSSHPVRSSSGRVGGGGGGDRHRHPPPTCEEGGGRAARRASPPPLSAVSSRPQGPAVGTTYHVMARACGLGGGGAEGSVGRVRDSRVFCLLFLKRGRECARGWCACLWVCSPTTPCRSTRATGGGRRRPAGRWWAVGGQGGGAGGGALRRAPTAFHWAPVPAAAAAAMAAAAAVVRGWRLAVCLACAAASPVGGRVPPCVGGTPCSARQCRAGDARVGVGAYARGMRCVGGRARGRRGGPLRRVHECLFR